jgi:hypothetical protein
VWVAELYRIEETKELVRFFRGLDDDAPDMKVRQSEIDADPDKLPTLLATGFREVRQKKVKRRRVHKYLMSGAKVLEDCGFIAGRCIPIIPVYGKRWVVDGIERCMGHVRLAKDAQRLKNTLLSWLAEMAMRFDIEKPILTPGADRRPCGDVGRGQHQEVPVPAAQRDDRQSRATAAAQPDPVHQGAEHPARDGGAGADRAAGPEDLLGNQQAGEQMQPNMSGKAVELIQQRLDMQVFIYMSNLAKAMKRCGEVWLSMKKELIVEDERRMKVIHEDGSPGSVVMNQPGWTRTGEQVTKNDLTKAALEVNVDVGPSSTSRRAATVRAVTGMMQLTQDPQTCRC